ncbi:MAG: hypothetical protein HC887_07560 [Desulfobacteraceae bacterium]|nr:hypothetical protein [Desulfobacteraceae bacterium]
MPGDHTSHYFRLSPKSDTIEVYKGTDSESQIYEAEMNYDRYQISPDRHFEIKQIENYGDLNNELIAYFPPDERILPYTEHGEIQKASDLADQSVSDNDIAGSDKVIKALSKFKSEKSIEFILRHLKKHGLINCKGMRQRL